VVESPFEPRLAPRGHSDYPADPVFDAIVADVATTPVTDVAVEVGGAGEVDVTVPTDVSDGAGPTASGAEPPSSVTGPEATQHQRVDNWGSSSS
jgi:hypothetical protein